jgi:hypothetical protein
MLRLTLRDRPGLGHGAHRRRSARLRKGHALIDRARRSGRSGVPRLVVVRGDSSGSAVFVTPASDRWRWLVPRMGEHGPHRRQPGRVEQVACRRFVQRRAAVGDRREPGECVLHRSAAGFAGPRTSHRPGCSAAATRGSGPATAGCGMSGARGAMPGRTRRCRRSRPRSVRGPSPGQQRHWRR